LSLHFLSLLPSLPSSLQNLLASLAILWTRKYTSGNSSCQVQLQLYFSFTDCSCLLPFSIFRTSQGSIVFYQFSILIVSCNSGHIRLQMSSSIFSSSIVTLLPYYSSYNCFLSFFKFYGVFSEFYFGYHHLITYPKRFIVN
jgi:hypothetical protein